MCEPKEGNKLLETNFGVEASESSFAVYNQSNPHSNLSLFTHLLEFLLIAVGTF